MNIKEKSQEIKAKYNKLKTKAINEIKRLAVATVLIQFILAITFFNLAKTDIFKVFTTETRTIHNVQASTEPQKEEKTPETVKQTIERVAQENDFEDIDLLLRIAECESRFDRYAENPESTATGVFQYLEGTWIEGVKRTGKDWELADRYNPEKATEMTIYWINQGELSKWNASKHCWNK